MLACSRLPCEVNYSVRHPAFTSHATVVTCCIADAELNAGSDATDLAQEEKIFHFPFFTMWLSFYF